MTINLLSANIVTQIREKLLNKVNKIISKRAQLFANMNLYSIDLFSKLTQEINQQLFMVVTQAKIHGIEDVSSIPTDNFMAICDSKSFLEQRTQVVQENKSVTSSKMNESYRKRRFSTIARTQKSQFQYTKPLSTIFQNTKQFEPLRNGQNEQQTRQIEAYRQMKKRQFEERAKILALQIKNKQRAPINLNIEDVMYDYDYKLTTIEKQKQRKWKSVPHVSPNIKTQYDQKKKRKMLRELMSRNVPINIKEKINITLKQREIEREKQKKKRNYSKNNVPVQTQSTVHLVKVNLESHKELEEAILVKQPGIKITIKQRQFNVDKQSTRTALTKITRRLSKSEYLQFKADQEKKRIIKNSHLRFTEKVKQPKVEQPKTQVVKQEAKPAINQNNSTQNTYKLSLSLDNKQSDRDKSRIFIHNVLGKAQLIKEVKHKNYLIEPQQQGKSKRDSLSIVDKYNLLYIKYHGNPPQSTVQNVKEQLQQQTKQVEKIKQNTISFNQNKKQSVIRENLINSRKV